jgi:L-ascorbate metabolism protein UlaG (beta-lactamase superfamily)
MRRPGPVIAALGLTLALAGTVGAQEKQALTFNTSGGTLEVTPLGHASLVIKYGNQVIHVDPYSQVGDYSKQPKATQVWITHDHPDHLDLKALDAVVTSGTRIVADQKSAEKLKDRQSLTVLLNGQNANLAGNIKLEAVPAYNLVRERAPGQKYHPKGDYNGYVATFGNFRVLIGGDTECIPEHAGIPQIDLAFLPINLPFTMPPEEAAACAKTIKPKIFVPYHQGESDPQKVADLLKDSGIDVRVLKLP